MAAQFPIPIMNRLRGLSPEDLNETLENQEKLDQLVMDSEEVQSLQLEREMSLASNRCLAETNLELKPRLEQGRAELLKKYEQLRDIQQSVIEQRRKLEAHSRRIDLESLLAVLRAEVATLEEESEELADSFLEGRSTLDSFLSQYAAQRVRLHSRKVGAEKLLEIVLRPSSTPAPSPAPLRPPPPAPTHRPPPSQLPYDPAPSRPGDLPGEPPFPRGAPSAAGCHPSFPREAPLSYPGGAPACYVWGGPPAVPSQPGEAPPFPAPAPHRALPPPQAACPYPQSAPPYPIPHLPGPPPSYPAPPSPHHRPQGMPYPSSPHHRPQGMPYPSSPYHLPQGMPYPSSPYPRPY